MQIDIGCAPNFNQRSSHFSLFFFPPTLNTELGQTIWDLEYNSDCSHLLTWASYFNSLMLQTPCIKRNIMAST